MPGLLNLGGGDRGGSSRGLLDMLGDPRAMGLLGAAQGLLRARPGAS